MFCLWKRMLKLKKRGENGASQKEWGRGQEREEKTPARKHCGNEKHPLISHAWLLFQKWVADQSTPMMFRPSKQKECFGVVSTEIWKEVGLPFVHFMQYSDRVCNPCGWKIHNFGASFTSLLKLQLHPQRVPRLRAANILLTRGTKPAQHEENQNLFVSIREQLSHPRSKVPSRLLKANQESLTPFLFWRK